MTNSNSDLYRRKQRSGRQKAWVLNNHSSCWAPVAHACNPSYSAGRDQEDHETLSQKNPTTKIGLVEWFKV
jgi:hypothetical protein